MTSDYFIVPLHPDYFSSMALSSLANTLPRWKAWAKQAYSIDVLQKADYPFPDPNATFIGAIIRKFPAAGRSGEQSVPALDRPTARRLRDVLIPALEKSGLLNSADFNKRLGEEPWQPILDVADFNSLLPRSPGTPGTGVCAHR